jgi:hypothetical protein
MTEDLWLKVLEIVKSRLPKDYALTEPQMTGLQAAWEKKKYKDFYRKGFSDGYLSNVLIPVYALLSQSIGVVVRKNNFKEVIENLILDKGFFDEAPDSQVVVGVPPKIGNFLGREQEQEILEAVYSQQKVIIINGYEGIGKTALASAFFQKISKTKKFQKYIWYRASELSKEDYIFQINKLLNPKREILSFSDFHSYILENKVFIVIDGLDLWISNYLDETIALIKKVVELPNDSLIILTFCESLNWFMHLEDQGYPVKNIKLDGLNREDTKLFFKLRGIEDKRIDEIYDSIRGNPIAILDACKQIKFMNGEVAQYIKYKTLFLTKIAKERLDKVFNTESSKVKLRERHILFILMQGSGGQPINKSSALDLVDEKTDYNLPEIIESMKILIDNALISIDMTNPLNLVTHDEVKGYIAQNLLNLFHFENIE